MVAAAAPHVLTATAYGQEGAVSFAVRRALHRPSHATLRSGEPPARSCAFARPRERDRVSWPPWTVGL